MITLATICEQLLLNRHADMRVWLCVRVCMWVYVCSFACACVHVFVCVCVVMRLLVYGRVSYHMAVHSDIGSACRRVCAYARLRASTLMLITNAEVTV